MDIRSFQPDLELMLVVRGRSFADDLRVVEAGSPASSHELTAGEWIRAQLVSGPTSARPAG